MNSAYERLKAVIIALGYTSNEKFEDTVGLGHGFVSRITNRVSSKSLQAITRKFPQVNPSYIRTGMGEMFISSPIKVSENENAKTAVLAISCDTILHACITYNQRLQHQRLFYLLLLTDKQI